MENMQLSLLTALFGGKAVNGGLLAETPSAGEGEAQKNPQGFLSFLQGLLAAAPESEELVNAPVDPKPADVNGKLSFHGLNAEKLRDLFGDAAPEIEIPDAEDAEPAAFAFDAAPFAAVPAQARAAGEIGSFPAGSSAVLPETPAIGAPVMVVPLAAEAAPLSARTAPIALAKEAPLTATPAPSAAAASPAPPAGVGAALSEDAPLVVRPSDSTADEPFPLIQTVKPAHGSQPAAPAGEATAILAARPGEAQPAIKAGGPVEPETAAFDIAEQEMLPESGEPDTASDADAFPARAPLKAIGLAGNANANAATAIADHASPQALAHSAVTREEAPAGLERLTMTRIENTTQGAERNAHLNPVRDQIIAAVAARPGDSRLEVRLDPPELGRVMIGFERDGADIVRAVVTADSPETLDLMRRNADVFQRALEQQGFSNLDLQFADRSAKEDAPEDARIQTFAVTEEDIAAAGAPPQHQGLVNGRLDRRL